MGQLDTPFSVVIPWRATQSRLPALRYTLDWFRRNLNVEPILCDSRHSRFNLSASRNTGVRLAKEKVIVICDADSFPEVEPLLDSVHAVNSDYRAHIPYITRRQLDRRDTREIMTHHRVTKGHKWDELDQCGGIMVTTKDIWASHGGQDERFSGWGFEDWAWRLAHQTLIGDIQRHDGYLTALYHELASRDSVPQNEAFYGRYQEASGDRDAMNRLVFTERGLDIP